jgi:small subunit ribosomal protein S14
MSKKCMINRNEKRKKIVDKFLEKRASLKENIMKSKDSPEKTFQLYQELALLPRASSKTRVSNRCFITGRSRGVYRRFGLCRNELRRLASFSDITGLKKSSW